MSKLTWSYPKSADYDTCSLADGLLRHYLTPPPAPAAPPKPTWRPSHQAADMLFRWREERDSPLTDAFLRRLYAQLHRDRVAGLARVGPASADTLVLPNWGWMNGRLLLSLADDGNGA